MSKEFSTDELIYALDQDRGSFEGVLTNNEIDAIIARLRAADKLCKAAKCISWDAGPDVLNDFDTTLFRMVTSRANIRDFRKAIAEYEGKP